MIETVMNSERSFSSNKQYGTKPYKFDDDVLCDYTRVYINVRAHARIRMRTITHMRYNIWLRKT